ncbi:Hypothetical protein PHPALM_5375 [Phytophthora palmivora]|uniref:Peptidase A2 domain-containing protein n=1 Tax=Phytophthora palmivora TaxID=4796 RepID=A0A2P4YHI8_9STRA|nr:Hypothetical protein PHPALM_5375 [Phytophthora palmivora]
MLDLVTVERTPTRPRDAKLRRGERLGWWSSQKFDRQVRMRALVMGAVNDKRVKILLDTGANVSAVSSTLARKLRLNLIWRSSNAFAFQGIGKDKMSTTHKSQLLGTDFMIPAGIRLDLYNSAAKLPDEVVVPLLRSLKDTDDQTYGLQTADGPTEALERSSRTGFKPGERPSLTSSPRSLATCPRATSVWTTAHFPVVIWLPHGKLPPEGYVRLNSAKYRDWQVLAYESAIDKELLYKEQELYADWLSRQPPAVERKPYHWPRGVKERPPEAKNGK